MDADRVVIELSDWSQGISPSTRRQMRRRSTAGVLVGAGLVVLAAAGAWATLTLHGPTIELAGVASVLVVGGLLCWQGVRRLRRLPRGHDDAAAGVVMPYAFAIAGDAIELPGSLDQDAERWPLQETVASARRRLGTVVLQLSCAGRRSRRYPAFILAIAPEEASRLVAERQAAARDPR